MVVVYILFTIFLLVVGSNGYGYVEEYFDQKIDHFNFELYGNRTFKQRYLYNDTYWDRGKGPIFFFAGNEDDIVFFLQNAGFLFQIAPQFQALLVFVEHRYYGKSLPFGQDSYQLNHIGLLDIQQVLADFAFFLTSYKRNLNADSCPIIAFGQGYGGALAAYMRFKYPNIIKGAIASSAPIYQLAGLTSGNLFFQRVTQDFQKEPGCENRVRSAFMQIQNKASIGSSGLEEISQTFHLCKPLKDSKDVDHFLRWNRHALSASATYDYPYPTSFITNFPAYPVNVMCSRLRNANSPVEGLYSAAALFYNSSDTPVTCFDIYKEYAFCSNPFKCNPTGPDPFDYQTCTELNLEGGSNGVKDMFPYLPLNSSMRNEYCLKTWNVFPRRDWLKVIYWGDDIAASSNIVFSNGNLDPLAPGGVHHDISDTLVTFIIHDGAHHLDFRANNPKDPASVRNARLFETSQIRKWLGDHNNQDQGLSIDLNPNDQDQGINLGLNLSL